MPSPAFGAVRAAPGSALPTGAGSNRDRPAATWEEMKRNPRPNLPALKAQLTMQCIEAATDKEQLRGILNAVKYLVLLGGDEGRNMLVARLKELQQKRDVLSPELKARGRRLSSTTPPSEQESFEAGVMRLNRLLPVESTIASQPLACPWARWLGGDGGN